jgi:hypothetical protein
VELKRLLKEQSLVRAGRDLEIVEEFFPAEQDADDAIRPT